MEIIALSGFVNGIFALSFGILVIAKNFRDRANQLFFLMTLATAWWAFSYWQWLSSYQHNAALFWVRMLSIGSLFIPIFHFHWIVHLLGVSKRKGLLLAIIYLFALGILFFSFTNLFVADVYQKLFFLFWPSPGALYNLYLVLIYLALVTYSSILLVQHYPLASSENRGQLFYILLGTFFGFLGGATNFFLWYDIPIPPYGNFLVALFPFLLGYAVLRHKLFNVKVVATELLIFAVWAFLLIRFILADNWQERIVDGSLLILVIFFGILLIRSVLREVQQREELEFLTRQLKIANEELKKLDAAKSEFISIAGHQLRAPLTVIKGYVSMLLEGTLGKVSELAGESMKKVAISANQLVKLVSDLLDLSRIEAGRLRYEFKDIVFDDVVAEVVAEVEPMAKSKGIGFLFSNHNPLRRPIKADPDKIREVVMNLVDNAIKYTSEGRVSVELVTERKDSREWLQLKIQDTGIGIKAEDIPKMFTKFARTDEAKKLRPDGMGLGLYVVKKIVEDHGGEVRVESPGLGKGSTFFVELPLADTK